MFNNTMEESEELLSHTEWEISTGADINEWLNDEEVYFTTHFLEEMYW